MNHCCLIVAMLMAIVGESARGMERVRVAADLKRFELVGSGKITVPQSMYLSWIELFGEVGREMVGE